MKSRRNRILSIDILAAVILTLSMSPAAEGSVLGTPVPGGSPEVWLPFASAPTGQWGGALSGEYDRRSIAGDQVTVQRVLFRLGLTPLSYGAFWVEGGLASLELESLGRRLEGDWGTALGAGLTLALPGRRYLGSLAPFGSGRVTYFISRLSDDLWVDHLLQTRRSRYEWIEGLGLLGLSRPVGKGMLFGGFALRALYQNEERITRAGYEDSNKRDYNYRSGLKGGAVAAAHLDFPHRLSAWVAVEVFAESARVTITFGQWGKPY